MQFTTSMVFNASTEIAKADQYPNIRVFTVGQGTTSATVIYFQIPNIFDTFF
jgi:hypothetical protein